MDFFTFLDVAQKSGYSRFLIDSIARNSPKSVYIARIPNILMTPKKREITERIFVDTSRTILRMFSTSINVTCGPDTLSISFFHHSGSVV